MTVDWDDSLIQLPIPKLSIQSLVENSIKHAVEQVSEPVMITITAHLTDQDVLITVRDNGPGISPERLQQVLSSFEQTFIEREGSHIGPQNLHTRLQILYGEQAGLLIDSNHTGTELSMYIPQGANLMYSILILDDEEPLREAIRILGEWDNLEISHIYEAINGQAGLSILREHPIDLVMVDMKMPGMNGVEFLKKSNKTIPIC